MILNEYLVVHFVNICAQPVSCEGDTFHYHGYDEPEKLNKQQQQNYKKEGGQGGILTRNSGNVFQLVSTQEWRHLTQVD